MKLFKLTAIEEIGWDSYSDFVVRAESELKARQICQEHGGAECGWNNEIPFWTTSNKSTCVEISIEKGPYGIICESFHAG